MSRTKVESELVAPRRPAAQAVVASGEAAAADWIVSPDLTDFTHALSTDAPTYLARAPLAMDVMGGLAEYTGALVLHLPIGDAVCVAVQRQAEPTITVHIVRSEGDDDDAVPAIVSAPALLGTNGSPRPADEINGIMAGSGCRLVRCAIGAIVESIRAGMLARIDGGLSIAVRLCGPRMTEFHCDTAVITATVVAMGAANNIALNPFDVAAIAQKVANDWLALPSGIADAVCVLAGRPDSVGQLRCDPHSDAGSIPLPDSLELLSVACGEPDASATEKYAQVRTASFMGRFLVDRIIQHEGAGHMQWDGYLSRVSITDYVERFRDRLPTKLRGDEFLDRFGETGDPLTTIDPDAVYRIRSRTEHHIYEHARVCQFAQCLSRAMRSGDRRALIEAGELMYASHWSYGQRCGLGAVNTDLFVSLIRKLGAEAGVLGAKVAGRGCGGLVTVFMDRTEAAETALAAALEAYAKRTGHEPVVLRGTSAGSLVSGARQR